MLGYINRIFGYNTEAHPDEDPFTNVWQLTMPEFRGRVIYP